MSGIKFKLKPIKSKPKRSFRKGSKYDPILDEFNEGKDNLVGLTVEGKDANYIRTQLNKRIKLRGLEGKVNISVVSNVAYLEKVQVL